MQVLVMRFMVRAVMRWRKPPATLRTLHHYGRGLASQPTRNGLREGKLRALWRSSVILAALLDESYVLTLSRLRDLDSPSLGRIPPKEKIGEMNHFSTFWLFSAFLETQFGLSWILFVGELSALAHSRRKSTVQGDTRAHPPFANSHQLC